jgi:hypothetical protein
MRDEAGVEHFAVTAHPTMAGVIQQLRKAMAFGQQPTYLFPDNDGICGEEVSRFLVGTGIEEVKTACRSPWQNPFVERYGRTLRRELLDHVIVLSQNDLRRLLKEFIEEYYHVARPHRGLRAKCPFPWISLSLSRGPAGWYPFPSWGACITGTFAWPPCLGPITKNNPEVRLCLLTASLPVGNPCAGRGRFPHRLGVAAILNRCPRISLP